MCRWFGESVYFGVHPQWCYWWWFWWWWCQSSREALGGFPGDCMPIGMTISNGINMSCIYSALCILQAKMLPWTILVKISSPWLTSPTSLFWWQRSRQGRVWSRHLWWGCKLSIRRLNILIEIVYTIPNGGYQPPSHLPNHSHSIARGVYPEPTHIQVVTPANTNSV